MKTVCRKAKCHVQTSRSLQSDCHVNATGTLCFIALELDFSYIHWGLFSRLPVLVALHSLFPLLASFYISNIVPCPSTFAYVDMYTIYWVVICTRVAKGRKVSEKFPETFNRKSSLRIFQIGNFRGVNGNLWKFRVI